MAEEQNNGSDSNEQQDKPKMATIGQLFSFAPTRQTRLCLVLGVIFSIITGSAYPAMAFYFAQAFSDLAGSTTSSDFMDTIRELAAAFLILGVIIGTCMTMQAFWMETAATSMATNMKTTWFRALLRQDFAYYDIMNVSGQATVITTNANKYRKGVGRKLAELVQYVVTFGGGVGYAFWAEWRTSLAVLAVSPFMVVSSLFLLQMNSSVTARANASYAQAGSIVQTAVSCIRTVLALNAVPVVIHQFEQATKQAYHGAVSQVGMLGLANGMTMVSMLLSYVVVTLFGSWLLYDQVDTEGCDPSGMVLGAKKCDPAGADIFGALMGITFAATVLPQVSNSLEALTAARVACYPALAVMNRRVQEHDETDQDNSNQIIRRGGSQLPPYKIDSSSTGGTKLDTVEGDIEFRNVMFHYPTRQETNVFQNFSLEIGAGKTVALVGFSGSGKSTVVQLLERFYDPQEGFITLDGINLKELNVKWLRQQIGLVSQEPKLFDWTIRENIAADYPEATNEQIQEAAKMANAHDFIMGFPQGYDTAVGDLGSQLSGGQRQRICIARSLVKKPKVLILDEATSSLDSESEKTVQAALDDLMTMKGLTTIVIAHRLSTIIAADVIAVVNDGVIAESGTHADLLENQSLYYNLVEAQKGARGEEDDNSETPATSEVESEPEAPLRPSSFDSAAILEFENVHFDYPSRPDTEILRGLNLSIQEGETLAIIGPSGSGKSTIIQLIECFYRPTEGLIRYKGVDMKELNVKWLRDEVGLVAQEPVLFDASIEENIRYSLPDASREQVIEAAKLANAHDFIMQFPEGYSTSVGQGSSLVSGGQKQRIAIARALIKKPMVLLLDEATSALDSRSEAIVQEALDKIFTSKRQTCVVVAHRLSTIRRADRVCVIQHGKVREIGTHNELMDNPNGLYRRLQTLQKLDLIVDDQAAESSPASNTKTKEEIDEESTRKENVTTVHKDDEEAEMEDIDKEQLSKYTRRACILASQDSFYLVVGAIGAVLAGLMFPAWGFIFAYMIEILYRPIIPCPPVPDNTFAECDEYWSAEADQMREDSFDIFYGFIGVLISSIVGFFLLFWGFGVASERMNRRVRNAVFTSLMRQEVAWFDLRSPNALTSRLSDDAALMHSFSGEPIRSLCASVASVLVGVVVSFVYMWPFALLTLAILPFMAFGAETEVNMYWGEDEGDDEQVDTNSPGGIVIEALTNIRTVASLTLEEQRARQYEHALESEVSHPIRSNIIKGGTVGLGQFIQCWGIALMFFWGGWLLNKYPDDFSYREFLVSMFALWFSLYGLTVATQNLTDKSKARCAAARIFSLTDRQSLIDPLAETGKRLGGHGIMDGNDEECCA